LRKRSERGQAAVEFVFSLMIIIALSSLLYQAMNFELDVYNKSAAARYDLFRKAHQGDESQTDGEDISSPITGKNLSDVTSYRVLLQPSTGGLASLHYGPRTYYGYHGTKYWDVLPGISGILDVLLLADHYEDTAGKAADVVGEFDSILNALNSI
jgi:hypothetical protein